MKHRLLIHDGPILRRLASLEVTDRDGSIILNIVRKGTSSDAWEWSKDHQDFVPLVFEVPRAKSLRVTVHPSGQVNYHKDKTTRHTVFLPSPFELTGPIPIVEFVVPGFAALDAYEGSTQDASIFELVAERTGRIGFSFAVLPASAETLPGELWRVMMWGAFGISCSAFNPAKHSPMFERAPTGAFTTVTLERAMPAPAMKEDAAYIKFHQAVVESAAQSVLGAIANGQRHRGPSIFGPRNGIWTVVCAVQMRIHPVLEIKFGDARYRADTISIEPWDRLQLVRVQFKVFDTFKSAYVKTPVEIAGYTLDAEL